ncbi:MAG: OmpA family protein [Endomicrobium sp.]|jgi:outer membrane protein OmpA-like peptidoglycan-associated protein|nr:OmpA family protein [Endomicrobium sp.]
MNNSVKFVLKFIAAAAFFIAVSHVYCLGSQDPGDKDYAYEIWEADGDENGNVYIRRDIADKLELAERKKIYIVNNDEGRVFFFNSRKGAEKYLAALKMKSKDIKESIFSDGKISFEGNLAKLGNLKEGVLIEETGRGCAELRSIPEEAKQAKRNAIIASVIDDSDAVAIWELKEENEKIRITPDMYAQLGIEGADSVWLVKYVKRIFMFRKEEEAVGFLKELIEAGARVDNRNVSEITIGGGAIRTADIKEIGDMSQGVIVELYIDDVTEIKSAAQEKKIQAAKGKSGVTAKEIADAKARRKKKMIQSFSINAANFKTSKFELTQTAKENIKRQVKNIKKYNYKKITIEGHADATGKRAMNLLLSKRRARAVYKEFLSNGIPASKMEYVGFGESMPVASNKTAAGRALNRRTEVFVE